MESQRTIDRKSEVEWFNEGIHFMNSKKYTEALTCFEKTIEINPNDADNWRSKGICLKNLKKYGEAIRCYNKAIEINPNDADNWYWKGSCLDSLERYEEAMRCFDKAIEINPNDEINWKSKGHCLRYLKRYEEAIKCFDKAIEIDPESQAKIFRSAVSHDLERQKEKQRGQDKQNKIIIYKSKQKDKAETALNNAQQILEKANQISLYPDKRLLELARSYFGTKNYNFSIQHSNNFIQKIETLVNESKPSLSFSLADTTFKLNIGSKTEFTLINDGNQPAKNINIVFSGDVDIRILSEVTLLNPGENRTFGIWIRPRGEGELPIDATIRYNDNLDRKFENKKELWISVGQTIQSNISQPPAEELTPAQFSPRTSATSSFPPEISHHYSEPEFIGKGGFARVFRTKCEDGRVVAVKIPISLDEATGKSFIREISIWQQLSHENIIDLYDMNVIPIPFLELEYADGGTLESLKKPMEIEQASWLLFNVAEGLKHAHDQGIAHRDLKPQNILLTGDLTPKITDWGLSKVMAESKSSSRFGFTPIYAAPEQISPKKFGRPDFRTDIYQIGVIFYELITGKVPFEGEDFSEIGFAIISDEPEPPSILNPECSEVDGIILKCLNKQPDDRYQTIAEFQQDLAGYLKIEYTKSLAKSAGDLKRSCIYCGDLMLIHAKINDVEGALKYAVDMKNYAGDGWGDDVEGIVKQLDYLAGQKQPIGDEFMSKINVVLHQLKMGR